MNGNVQKKERIEKKRKKTKSVSQQISVYAKKEKEKKSRMVTHLGLSIWMICAVWLCLFLCFSKAKLKLN